LQYEVFCIKLSCFDFSFVQIGSNNFNPDENPVLDSKMISVIISLEVIILRRILEGRIQRMFFQRSDKRRLLKLRIISFLYLEVLLRTLEVNILELNQPLFHFY
jgi:hypothetical protein